MFSHILIVGALAMAEAQFSTGNVGFKDVFPGQPTWMDSQGIRTNGAAKVEVVCEADTDFFEKGLVHSLLQHPEFDSSNVKIALSRGAKYLQVDQPFSHEANALSLAQVEIQDPITEDEIRERRATNLRSKIRAKHAWNATRIDEGNKQRKKELEKEEKELQTLIAKNEDVSLDVWYVNMDGAKERKRCLERQFSDMPGKPQPKRFPALKFPEACIKSKTHEKYETCLKEADLGDCFEAGIDYAATGTHGTQEHTEYKIRNAVLSNWCGHKRLFKQVEEAANNGTAPQYVVVLEDDVIVDRKYFMQVLKDFAKNYKNRDWDLVQLDPFGHKDRKDFKERFRGKPVFKPSADGQCSAYWGFHAVMIKVSAIKRINHWMSINQAVPIDWLPWRMPHSLAYSALISRNPEAKIGGDVIVLPGYCSQKVMKSTIG